MAEFSENRHISNLINMSCKVESSTGSASLPRLQSMLVETICGADIANNILEWNSVGYFRDTCVAAVKESSSSIEPHRTLSDKVVHSLLLHGAVRTYLRYVLWSVFVQVVV